MAKENVQWIKDTLREVLKEGMPEDWQVEDVGNDIQVSVPDPNEVGGLRHYWVWVATAKPWLRRPDYSRGREV
jgi:hypothetical protein